MVIFKRTFTSLDEEAVHMVYKCPVGAHLEYENVIWNPKFTADKMLKVPNEQQQKLCKV